MPRTIDVATADGPMPVHLWSPPAGTGPGLVVVQEIFGVGAYVRARCADLAALGYLVAAPEVYWRLDGPPTPPDAGSDADALEAAVARAGRVDWPAAVADVAATVAHLRGLVEVEGGVGLVGFCFGGGLAFNVAAVEPVEVLVSYYGSALPGLLDLAPRVGAPSLHHLGDADAYLDGPTRERIRRAVVAAGATVVVHEGAGHAFDNPDPAFHHAEAAARAWDRTVSFLAEHLPVRAR